MDSSKKVKEINNKHRKHIESQLRKFKKDDSYYKDYKGLQFGNDECLVRMFVYSPPKQHRPSEKLIIPNLEGRGIAGADKHKLKEIFFDDVVMPFGKVIIPGKLDANGPQYKQGDIVAFFSNRVMGVSQNPEYIHWLQAQDVGMATPKGEAPKPTIPTVQTNFETYQYTRPGNLYPDDQDDVTFVLPTFEFRPFDI